MLNSDSGQYRDFPFDTYEDAISAQEILQWLEPEPAVGSAVMEEADIQKVMQDWERFVGKPLRQAEDA